MQALMPAQHLSSQGQTLPRQLNSLGRLHTRIAGGQLASSGAILVQMSDLQAGSEHEHLGACTRESMLCSSQLSSLGTHALVFWRRAWEEQTPLLDLRGAHAIGFCASNKTVAGRHLLQPSLPSQSWAAAWSHCGRLCTVVSEFKATAVPQTQLQACISTYSVAQRAWLPERVLRHETPEMDHEAKRGSCLLLSEDDARAAWLVTPHVLLLWALDQPCRLPSIPRAHVRGALGSGSTHARASGTEQPGTPGDGTPASRPCQPCLDCPPLETACISQPNHGDEPPRYLPLGRTAQSGARDPVCIQSK